MQAQPTILFDAQVRQFADMNRAIARVAGLLSSGGHTPPRHYADFGRNTELVFSIGGGGAVGGARAYFSRDTKHYDDQAVLVWDMQTGAMKGAVFGFELGVLRMGAIGGVTIDALAPQNAETLAIIGTGRQAMSHLLAAAAVRKLAEIRVFGRDPDRLRQFTQLAEDRCGRKVKAATSAEQAVRGVSIVVLATNSLLPVVSAEWLDACRLIHSVGFKSPAGKELGLDVANVASAIVTDSPEQVRAFGSRFVLHGTEYINRMQPLADYVRGQLPAPEGLVLSYPMGISGSDVVVADDLIEAAVASSAS